MPLLHLTSPVRLRPLDYIVTFCIGYWLFAMTAVLWEIPFCSPFLYILLHSFISEIECSKINVADKFKRGLASQPFKRWYRKLDLQGKLRIFFYVLLMLADFIPSINHVNCGVYGTQKNCLDFKSDQSHWKRRFIVVSISSQMYEEIGRVGLGHD